MLRQALASSTLDSMHSLVLPRRPTRSKTWVAHAQKDEGPRAERRGASSKAHAQQDVGGSSTKVCTLVYCMINITYDRSRHVLLVTRDEEKRPDQLKMTTLVASLQ